MLLKKSLLKSIKEKQTKNVISTLTTNPDSLNLVLEDGKTALHLAVENNYLELVQALTEIQGIDLNAQTGKSQKAEENGRTAVFMASYLNSSSTDILKLLIAKGADTSIASANGQTPLTVALWFNRHDAANLILETGKVNINSMINKGHTALINAVEKSDVVMVEKILSVPGLNVVNHKMSNGESALFIAARKGYVEKVKALLKFPGIDIEAKRTPGDDKSALQIAEEQRHIELAEVIVESYQIQLDVNPILFKKYSFADYVVNLRKIPTQSLYLDFLKEIKTIPYGKSKVTPKEVEYIKARNTWTNVVSDMDRINKNQKTNDTDFNQKIFRRFKKLGYTTNIEKLYLDCIDYIKINSAVVLTFDASFLKKGLTDYQPLNMFENKKYKHYPDYKLKRELTEQKLFQDLKDNIKSDLFSNIHAQPRYAALLLLDRNHNTEAIYNYGQSRMELDPTIKYNSLFNAHDSMIINPDNQDLIPCTYHHLDFILLQCSEKLLRALLERVTTGMLPANYSQQYQNYYANGGYIEALIPPVNIFHFARNIFIHEDEYKLTPEEIALLKQQNITVINGKQDPYQTLPHQFMQSVEQNDVAQVQTLLKTYPSLAHITNSLGQEPIHIAAQKGYTVMVKSLIAHRVNPNRLTPDGKAPLHLAVENGHLELVQALVEMKEIELNVKTENSEKTEENGRTAVFMASYLNSSSTDILKLLIAQGADTSIASANGQTPLTIALWFNRHDAVNLILGTGKVNINSIINKDHTALINAVEKNDADMVEKILSVPDLNTVNHKMSNGESALFIAARKGHVEKVKALLKFPGIDIEAKRTPGDGKSALQIAEENGHNKIVVFLILHESKKLGLVKLHALKYLFKKGMKKYSSYFFSNNKSIKAIDCLIDQLEKNQLIENPTEILLGAMIVQRDIVQTHHEKKLFLWKANSELAISLDEIIDGFLTYSEKESSYSRKQLVGMYHEYTARLSKYQPPF